MTSSWSTYLSTFLQHPSFWPGFVHTEGDFGFNFQFKQSKDGPPIPFETTQLNVTSNSRDSLIFDYTYVTTEEPPQFEFYPFEKYDWKGWTRYGTINWHFPFVVGVVYLALIFGLQRWMRDRPAYKLKWPLFVWNLGLGVFSIVGFYRTIPEFMTILSGEQGFYKAICFRNGGNWPLAYWSLLFVLSKYAELGDTLFIVLRKKPLVFIQWYHHLVTLAMSWLTAPYVEAISRWYVVMNYGVHSLMYPYFAISVLGFKIPRYISVSITTCQLTQMLIGLFVNLASALLIYFGTPCYRHPFSIKMSAIVYGSFSILFAKLYMDVINRGKARAKKEKSS